MSLLTTFYNLIKPQLTDSPPDITVMNPNWDRIDAELNSHEEQINSFTNYAVTTESNANNLPNGRVAATSLTANVPVGSSYYCDTYVNGGYGWQFIRRQSDPKKIYARGILGGSWTAWKEISWADDLVTDTNGAHGLKIESGTFTPILTATTNGGSHTYSLQVGKYTKINNKVFASLEINLTKDAAMSGVIQVTGLPFIGGGYPRAAINLAYFAGINMPDHTQLTGYIEAGLGTIVFYYAKADGSNDQISANAISGNLAMGISITYETY